MTADWSYHSPETQCLLVITKRPGCRDGGFPSKPHAFLAPTITLNFVLVMDTVDWTPGGLDLQLSNSKTREASKLRGIVEAKRNPGASVETTSYSRAIIGKDEKKLGPANLDLRSLLLRA
jgi:hypothetical protein